MSKYISTKLYPDLGPVAYRQWRADSHCNQIHGYSLSFYFEFEAIDLDARNWCVDFGGLRDLKDFLEEQFDHTLLVAEDDPDKEFLLSLGEKKFGENKNQSLAQIRLVEKTGCEGIAKAVFDYVNEIYLPQAGYDDRVHCCKVEVREHAKNSAMVVEHKFDA